MSAGPFNPVFEDLPEEIPIFPLPGVLLLPRGALPLNIFEPRYLAMTRAALAAPQRIIGMIQPLASETGEERPAVFRTGCGGRLTEFSETRDGRYVISLAGLIRFDVRGERPMDAGGFRWVAVDFGPYRDDLWEDTAEIDRDRLLAAVRAYFQGRGLNIDWDVVQQTSDERLVSSLAMGCPFEPNEKQALLEAPDLTRRTEILTALMEMSAMGADADGPRH
jgi:Lon protease-like protein